MPSSGPAERAPRRLRTVRATAAPRWSGVRRRVDQARHLVGVGAPTELPFSSVPLAIFALLAYSIMTEAAGGLMSVGLASIPLFVAAALLPVRSALVTVVLTIVVTMLPSLSTASWVFGDVILLVELSILVVAAVILRVAISRFVLTRAVQAEADGRLQERITAVLAIAERLTRTFDRTEIFQTVVRETHRILGVDGVTIRILRDGVLEIEASAGLASEVASRLPTVRADEGWFREVFETGRPWACDNLDDLDSTSDEAQRFRSRYLEADYFSADLVVPLIGHDRVIGVVSAVTNEPHHWTDADIEFVRALATHASIAISNAELFEQASTRAGQMSVLQAASGRMSRQNSVESVGRAVVEETRHIIDYHNARVYILEPPDKLVPIAFAGTVGAYEKVDMALLETRLGAGFTGWAAEHGTPLLIPDANADPRGFTIPGTDQVDESMLVVPMRYDERVTGAITLSKLGLNQFRDEDLDVLMILADQAATAIESVRLLARAQTLAGELRSLLDMSGELAHSLDPLTVADLIAKHLAGAMGFDQCAISYWDRPGDKILTWGFYPTGAKAEVEPSFPLERFPKTRWVLEEQMAYTVDVTDRNADPAEVEQLRRTDDKWMVMFPLVAKGEAIGLVELISRQAERPRPERFELARSMANEAAMALENAKLYEDARKLADHDHLTGFFNHRYVHERIGEELVRAQRSGSPVSLLMIDLDDFKLVNDTFGHLFGDRVLVWSTELIRSSLRLSDIPARYGGDEFAIVLPETDAAAATAVAERILATFAERSYESKTRGLVPVAASIGQATFPFDARTGPELIAAADGAMYRAKGAGGNGAAKAGGPGRATEGRSHAPARPRRKPAGQPVAEPTTADVAPGG
jgi:diguanylate cyclase (GGDEF)-like protein